MNENEKKRKAKAIWSHIKPYIEFFKNTNVKVVIGTSIEDCNEKGNIIDEVNTAENEKSDQHNEADPKYQNKNLN